MRRENARWRPEEAVARLRRVCLKTSNLQEQLWAEQGTDRWTWCPLPCACPGPLRRQPWRRRETFGHWWLTASQQSGWGLCVHLSEALWGNSRKPEDWAAKQPPETSSCSDFLSQSHQKHLLGPFKEHLLGIWTVMGGMGPLLDADEQKFSKIPDVQKVLEGRWEGWPSFLSWTIWAPFNPKKIYNKEQKCFKKSDL